MLNELNLKNLDLFARIIYFYFLECLHFNTRDRVFYRIHLQKIENSKKLISEYRKADDQYS